MWNTLSSRCKKIPRDILEIFKEQIEEEFTKRKAIELVEQNYKVKRVPVKTTNQVNS